MKIFNHKGNVLLFAIVAFTLISVLGTGIYFMTTSATFSGLGANQQNRAYQLAVSGRDYALSPVNNLGPSDSGDYTMSNGDKFNLVIAGDTITSTGIVNEGTPYEARRKISVTITGFGSRPDISFAKDIADFKAEVGKERESTPGSGFVSVDTTTGQISLGQFMASQFGAVWYSGTSASGNCQDGECDFGTGFNAFFVFRIQKSASYTLGDGFTFALFNGQDNDLYSVGGHGGMGELMAYAGSSYVSGSTYLDNKGGQGIRPPKIAVEFDPYPNTGCPSSPCSDNSRCDDSDGGDHMAHVFWGDNTTSCSGFGDISGQKSYDDNKHGSGSDGVSEPQNALTTDTNNYFEGDLWGSSWLERTVAYAFRIEVRRSDPGSGNYNYEVKSWIKECPDFACTAYSQGTFGNTKVAYTVDNPTIRRTVADGNQIVLDSTYHNKFDKFIFGWTAATSGATQNVILKDFKMYFAREPVYGVWNNLGSTSYFKINGAGVCTGIVQDSLIGNIGHSESIDGFTNSTCTIATSPSSISYDQAVSADTNKNYAVNFSGTDK
ncbi:MAG: hypothetical protein BWK74_04140 [Desulfobacteraceae bacterium A6]|nr:MAG: hypothetical protein BWK74_04140 [Desulfobacteraceae bacterium A6]